MCDSVKDLLVYLLTLFFLRRMGPSSLLTTHDQIRKEIYVKVLEFEQDSVCLEWSARQQ